MVISTRFRAARGTEGGFELNFVELGENLADFYAIAVVHVNLFDDAASLGFDFGFGERLNFPGGDDDAGEVAALDIGELGRVDFVVGAEGGFNAVASTQEDDEGDTAPDNTATTFFAILAVC